MKPHSIEIAAAGQSSRIREFIRTQGYPDDYPKFLLPTGNGNDETLLGRIVRQALEAPFDAPITINTTGASYDYIEAHSDIAPLFRNASVRVSLCSAGNSFGSFVPKLVNHNAAVIGSSADYYVDVNWRDVLETHNRNRFPATFVVGQTVAVDKGAVFDISDDGRISGFERKTRTNKEDFINVGIYFFEPTRALVKALKPLVEKQASEEEIVRALIDGQLLGAHVLSSQPFNVNTAETYGALLYHTEATARVA